MVDIDFDRVEALGTSRADVGEGPHWDAEGGLLWWVDLLAGLVHSIGLGSDRLCTWSLGRPVGAVVKRASGGFVVADSRGFRYLGPDGSPGDEIAVLGAATHERRQSRPCRLVVVGIHGHGLHRRRGCAVGAAARSKSSRRADPAEPAWMEPQRRDLLPR